MIWFPSVCHSKFSALCKVMLQLFISANTTKHTGKTSLQWYLVVPTTVTIISSLQCITFDLVLFHNLLQDCVSGIKQQIWGNTYMSVHARLSRKLLVTIAHHIFRLKMGTDNLGLWIWRTAVNILHKQSCIAKKSDPPTSKENCWTNSNY